MKTPPPKTIHLVYWYHAKDALWQEALDAHLKPFRRFIRTWCHGDIPPGAEWQQEVSNALTRADIIVLLVSADFLADDLNYERIQQAVERHKRKEVHVVPVILRPVIWQKTVLGSLDVLPAEGTPVTRNGNLDEEMLSKVATTLGEYAESWLLEKQQAHCIHEGDTLVDDGDYEAALQAYEQALQLFPSVKPPDVLRQKAKLLFFLKKDKKAWNAYEQLIRSGSAHVTDYVNLAEICYRLHYPMNAAWAYQGALRLEPRNATLHYCLASCSLYHLGEYQQAVDSYEQAIQYDPSHTQWYIEKGHALRRLGRYSEALEVYETVIQIDAGNALAFTNKGVTLYELKEYEPALKAYRQAVFLDPTNAIAYLGIAAVLVSIQKRPEEAGTADQLREVCMQAELLGYSHGIGHMTPSFSSSFPGSSLILYNNTEHLMRNATDHCTNGHKNPPGSIWCEQGEIPLNGSFIL